ncbi:MAG: hypothetical protein ACYCQJ_08160 [Nitrososphaerales archaeon]
MLSIAEEKHKPTSDSISLLNPHSIVRMFGGPYLIARATPLARQKTPPTKHAGHCFGRGIVIRLAW